jgi:uncharacterized tellurite resistance protein B-like protein
MSEEILKALMQLFAIIAKQDGGVEESEREFVQAFLRSQIGETNFESYISLFDKKAKSKKKTSKLREKKSEEGSNLTAVGDSVRTLGIAKKINKTLSQKQKIVVLVRLYELINSDKKFTEQRMAIITTVADVFNISTKEASDIKYFVLSQKDKISPQSIVVYQDQEEQKEENNLFVRLEGVEGEMCILKVESSDLYFAIYKGHSTVLINGLPLVKDRIYLFANGSTIRLSKGKPLYYSDVIARFMRDDSQVEISFQAKNISFQFPNGNLGLRDITKA